MDKIGTVIKINGNKAVVRVMRVTSCGENCNSCSGGCVLTRQSVEANNGIGATVGDKVKIELDDGKVLLAAFSFYIVPIITLICGYAFFDVLGGAIGFILPFTVLKALDKKTLKRYTANITRILE